MEKYRNFSLFIIFISTPDFPHFYYIDVRWKSGVTSVWRCFRDVGLCYLITASGNIVRNMSDTWKLVFFAVFRASLLFQTRFQDDLSSYQKRKTVCIHILHWVENNYIKANEFCMTQTKCKWPITTKFIVPRV